MRMVFPTAKPSTDRGSQSAHRKSRLVWKKPTKKSPTSFRLPKIRLPSIVIVFNDRLFEIKGPIHLAWLILRYLHRIPLYLWKSLSFLLSRLFLTAGRLFRAASGISSGRGSSSRVFSASRNAYSARLKRSQGETAQRVSKSILSDGKSLSLEGERIRGQTRGSAEPSIFRSGHAWKRPGMVLILTVALSGGLLALVSLESSSGSSEVLLENAYDEMDRRRTLLLQLSEQQDELHQMLSSSPARGILGRIFPSGYGSAGNEAYSPEPMQRMEAHLAANQRYLSDGLYLLQAIPHRWPVMGRVRLINSYYGNRSSPFGKRTEYHGGMDLKARTGDRIVATAEGYVYRVGRHGGFGNMVHIIHPSGFESIYAHLSHIDVKKGQTVRAGELLGRAGDTGLTTGPHLHYEIRLDGKRQDPIRYVIP
ncbi:MAG: M23 family metallopeptidase [Leptospiraceae bacterium]|nr:M23 family metallopeptidase [Leptospiraceae bacterium]